MGAPCPSVNTSPVFPRFFLLGRQALPGSIDILQTFTPKCSLLWTHIPHECLLPAFCSPATPSTIRVWRKLHFCYQDMRNECPKHPRETPRTKNPLPKR